MTVSVVLLLVVIALLLARAYFWPRYVEEASGVRDRWSGELCRIGLDGALAFCESGKILMNRTGRWGS